MQLFIGNTDKCGGFFLKRLSLAPRLRNTDMQHPGGHKCQPGWPSTLARCSSSASVGLGNDSFGTTSTTTRWF